MGSCTNLGLMLIYVQSATIHGIANYSHASQDGELLKVLRDSKLPSDVKLRPPVSFHANDKDDSQRHEPNFVAASGSSNFGNSETTRRSYKSRMLVHEDIFNTRKAREMETSPEEASNESSKPLSKLNEQLPGFGEALNDGFINDIELIGKSVVTCPFGDKYSFVRIPRAMIMGLATTVTSLDSVTCAQYCGNNTEPTTGAHRLCQGFNYIDSTAPTCELYDETAKIGPLSRNVGPRSYYYDKVCLKGKSVCGRRSFAFECLPDSQMQSNVVRTLQARNFEECLSACLEESEFVCMSVNFNQKRGVCELNRNSRRTVPSSFFSESKGFQYCENNCLNKATRCPTGSIFFVKTFNSEVEGFDATVTMENLDKCLNKCLESDYIFCRSVEYDRHNMDCIISDEDTHSVPDMVLASTAVNVDLYEPVCLAGASAKTVVCNRPYLFEKILNTALQAPGQISIIRQLAAEDCLVACSREKRCESVNYNRVTLACTLIAADRRNTSTTLLVNRQIDYYESNCNQAMQNDQPLQGCFFALEETGRQIRRDYRSGEMRTTTAIECKMNCIHSPDCRAISYSLRHRKCYLSQLDNSHIPFYLLTEAQPGYDTYTKRDCIFSQEVNEVDAVKPTDGGNDVVINPHTSRDNATTNITDASGDDMPASHDDFTLINCLSLDEMSVTRCFLATTLSVTKKNSKGFIQNDGIPTKCHFRMEEKGRRIKQVYTNDQVVVPSLPDCQLMCGAMMSYDCRSISFNIATGLCALSENHVFNLPIDAFTEHDPISDLYLKHNCHNGPPLDFTTSQVLGATDQSFHLSTSRRERPLNRRLSTPIPFNFEENAISVTAVCMEDGVNVTVSMPDRYSGAIYSAERFSLCRNIVTSQDKFWLFMPMPNVNTACNTIMQRDKMSGVVVISMDGIVPYDVTTKDDVFYQIQCDMDSMHQTGQVMVTSGIVIGGDVSGPHGSSFRGPEPHVVVGSGLQENFEAQMKIMKNDLAVQNVLLGDKLTLRINSNVDPDRTMIQSCNVSRIGGNGPLPQPLAIIEDGCPTLTQVVGPVRHTPNGLEATLTAFRIDGSAEIQIFCMVEFCSKQCVPAFCSDRLGSSATSFGKRRKRDVNTKEPAQFIESVNGRLKVFVEGEEGAPSQSQDSQPNLSAQAKCVPESTFLIITGALGFLLLSSLTILGCIFCRRICMITTPKKPITSIETSLSSYGSAYDSSIHGYNETQFLGNKKAFKK